MTERPAIIPNTVTPDELAQTLGASPRAVKDEVRAIGCYCKIGGKVLMRDHHVLTFMEAMECHSHSTNAATSGTTGAPLRGKDYAALQKTRTAKSHRASRQKPKKPHGEVISMVRGQR